MYENIFVQALMRTGIDVLVLENCVLEKSEQRPRPVSSTHPPASFFAPQAV
jgi:hypothetical protein